MPNAHFSKKINGGTSGQIDKMERPTMLGGTPVQ